jgi:hypothetical protein
MNYVEIYHKIYTALLVDGHEDDHDNYEIIQSTRSAAADITYSLWKFLLTCENYPSKNALNQIEEVTNDTINSIKNTLKN